MTNSLGIRVPLTLATAALMALTGTLSATPTQAAHAAEPAAARGVPERADVKLSRDPNSVVRAATVPVLDDTSVRRVPGRPQVSPKTTTSTFKMIGVTWRGDVEPDLSVRTRSGGVWTGWRPLDTMHDGPTGREPKATDLTWIGPAHAYQVRNTGKSTEGLEVVLINPGRKASDSRRAKGRLPAKAHAQVSRSTAAKHAPVPVLFSRRRWGADESWRNGTPRYNKRLMQVHIHHTVNSNSYSRADVPALLRGMYRYHTKSLGWFDIGYNFLVDRFGRIWIGRSGGHRQLVRGAHTLGFNHNSVGIAVIGNFQSATPPRVVIRGIVRTAAWKLDKRNKHATGKVRVRSEGSDRYPAGRYVRLPVVDGHRDTNETSCPGARLYRELSVIRRRAEARINQFN